MFGSRFDKKGADLTNSQLRLPCPDYLCKFGSGLNPHVVIYFISGPSPSGLDPDTASGMEFTTSLMYVLSVFENSNFTFRGPLL